MASDSTYLDPVVDRVRAIRRQIAEECEFDVHKLAELLRRSQAQHPERVATPKQPIGPREDVEPTTSAKP